MKIDPLHIPDVRRISTAKHGDSRGFFSEIYSEKEFQLDGLDCTFVQDNYSFSADAGVLRGLHFQKPPHAQGKLIRVLSGSIFDVAVDLRVGSPWYGEHVVAELSANNWQQLWIPIGFAHGYVTRERNTAVLYKVTDFYYPDLEGGLRWDDSALNIDWNVDTKKLTISEKDKSLPTSPDFKSPFSYSSP